MKTFGQIGIRPLSMTLLAMILLMCILPRNAESARSTWTKGHRKVLVIPARFTDASGPSDAVDPNGVSGWGNLTNGTTTAAISNFFISQSYGQFSVDFTIVPEVNLGVPTAYYTNNCPGSPYSKWTEWGAPGSLADDARDKARQYGLAHGMAALCESTNYDFDVIALGYNTYLSGAASDGGRTVIACNFNALPHELCHGLGLQHANGTSRASGYSPVTWGSYYSYFYDAYGDVYCLMGYKMNTRTTSPPPDRDANAYFKYELGWLTDTNISSPVTSGTYRVYAFDQGSVEPGKDYALRIPRDPSHTYWFDFRQAITNTPDSKWSQSGLEVHFGAESPRASSGVTMLWDMTPGSAGYITTNYIGLGPTFATMHDAPLQIGRTYSDAEANLHITPVKKGGTTPESLDVIVNFGPFPGNHAPVISISPSNIFLSAGVTQVFSVVAADPDGDPLSYYWEFDDNTATGGNDFGGLNADSRLATQGSHAWSQMGPNFVRCTVSDMKGQSRTVSTTVTVTNGSPAPLTVSGIITDELGNPLEGALVNNFKSGIYYGSTNFAGSGVTAGDGQFRIPLPRGNTKYVFSAMQKGYSFNCSMPGGTVTVASASITNVNFTRVKTTHTIGGGVYVAGRGYHSPTDGNLWVSTGTQSTLVSNGWWQLSVADGTYVTLTATPTNPAYTVSSDFPKPYLVVGDVDTLSFFVDIPGAMPQTGFASSGTNSDDKAGTVFIPVTMTLPAGMTNWPANQMFNYWIDDSSTAEYGVDYKMNAGRFTFYGSIPLSPYLIPLTIFHDSIPKNRTVVIKIAPGNSIAYPGLITTYTFTIRNTPYPTLLRNLILSNNSASFVITNLADYATNYILRSDDLAAPNWSTTHVFTGSSGQIEWTESISNSWNKVFYRVMSE